MADDAVEVGSKLIDHVEETLAKADDIPGHVEKIDRNNLDEVLH